MGGASVEHLSLLAHLTSLSLCHPPVTMVAPSDSQLPKLRPFLPLRSSLPCDVHLLNLRTLEDTQVRTTPGISWKPLETPGTSVEFLVFTLRIISEAGKSRYCRITQTNVFTNLLQQLEELSTNNKNKETNKLLRLKLR